MKSKKTEKTVLALLPLRDMVMYPGMVTPLLVGRASSITAVETCLAREAPIFLCTQRDSDVEIPYTKDLYSIGVVGTILQVLHTPEGAMRVVVQGLERGRVESVRNLPEYAQVTITRVQEKPVDTNEILPHMRLALREFQRYGELSQRVSPEISVSLRSVSDAGTLADLLAAYLPLSTAERQDILETLDHKKRLEKVVAAFLRENELLKIEETVRERVRQQMERGQREHFLHEQLRVIQQELGERGEPVDEFAELREQIEKARMPAEVRAKAEQELARYERMPPLSPEAGVVRTYLEWLVEMPWQKRTRDAIDLHVARRVLDEDHYGLDKVKERILEFLAVRKLSKNTKGPVLCLVGPPGVGKTSLGQSIARAMNRKFVRVSLGGVRDEAEIRGHRRTYIGSMPGRIIQSIKKVGVKNPVFMLDEVDKMSMDYRGDPAAALLEVLDPEQNNAFSDHYLEVDFDLHEVFFITTANTEFDIPPPLHDRMEIVRLSGYTAYEKEHIARGFLIPKQLQLAGLKKDSVEFTKEGIHRIISRYTREAGVRELERQIANICRKIARKTVESGQEEYTRVDETKVTDLLGCYEYPETKAEEKPQVGLAVGLAWTWSGGDILNIETSTMKGKGELTLTGQLGDVMKESAQAAFTYLRAHAKELRIPLRFHQTLDIHVHVPEGAIPKDGPSAGIALAVSMLSALRGTPPQKGIAMTGELTLRGRVLQVGAVKEKIFAAHRAGIYTIVLPKENEKDLADIPQEIRKDMKFVFVRSIDEVFRVAFPKKG